MAKIRDLLHPRPKIDEGELAFAQSRAAARLADLAERGNTAPVDTPSAADASPGGVEDGGIDSSAPVVGGDRETGRNVDVTTTLREGMRDVSAGVGRDPAERIDWQVPPGGLVPALPRPAAAPVDTPSVADASPDAIEDGGMTSVVPVDPGPLPGARRRPRIVVEGDADVVDRESGQVVNVVAPLHDGGVDSRQVPIVDGVPPVARPKAPIGRSQRSSSRDLRGSSSAGRSPTVRATSTTAGSAPLAPASCPYCALLLQPVPASSQRCVRCHQRIIVKYSEGRAVYLTEAAVPVFVAERRRVAASGRLTRERERWLRLAAAAGAPVESQARLAAARLTEGVVASARTLYLTTADRAFRAAKRDHDWEAASRIRREKATVLYRVAGSPLPPPADLVAMFREGVAAELRGIAEISRDAGLVSASCCDVCRADDRLISRISHELREPRLPHDGCPRGLCRCRWDLADRDRMTMRRYLRRRPRAESRISPSEPEPMA